MTPKEKSQELFESFYFPHYKWDGRKYIIDELVTKRIQKRCALIAVNEILGDIDDSILHPQNKEAIEYCEEVRKEIEILQTKTNNL